MPVETVAGQTVYCFASKHRTLADHTQARDEVRQYLTTHRHVLHMYACSIRHAQHGMAHVLIGLDVPAELHRRALEALVLAREGTAFPLEAELVRALTLRAARRMGGPDHTQEYYAHEYGAGVWLDQDGKELPGGGKA